MAFAMVEVAGCTDVFACNYNVDATDDDGSITSRGSVARMLSPATTIPMPCMRLARAITAAMLDVRTHPLVITIQTS